MILSIEPVPVCNPSPQPFKPPKMRMIDKAAEKRPFLFWAECPCREVMDRSHQILRGFRNSLEIASLSCIAGVQPKRITMEPNAESAIVEMTCIEVRALGADYLEGSLALGTYVRLDAHLAQCRHCSAIFDGVRAM
jgi:Putative zinc-finger